MWIFLGVLGSRRLADVVVTALACWFLLLLVWTQRSPLEVVARIGSMWTFIGIYVLVAVNTLACCVVELRRIARRISAGRGRGERTVPRLAPLWGMLFHLVLPLLLPTVIWGVGAREVVRVPVGVGETVTPGERGPQQPLTLTDLNVTYLDDQVFFTELQAAISVGGGPPIVTRINQPIGIDGGDLRVSSMGYMPGLEVYGPSGELLERAFLKVGLFPPGLEAEVTLAGVPQRLFLRLYPDAVRDSVTGEARNASMSLLRPLLYLRAVRGKLPLGAALIAPGESYEFEGYRIKFVEAGLWAALEWVRDPGAKLAFALCALALVFLAMRLLWPRAGGDSRSSPRQSISIPISMTMEGAP